MAIKKSRIEESTYKNPWENPKSGRIIHYFRLKMKNGDEGDIGVEDLDNDNVKVGTELRYTINDKNRIRPERDYSSSGASSSRTLSSKSKSSGSGYSGGSYKKSKVDFTGMAFGYAKDLVIAGKATKKSLTDVKRIAREILDEIDNILQEESK